MRFRLFVRHLSTDSSDRFNEFGIQLLPASLHDTIFKSPKVNSTQSKDKDKLFGIAKDHLRKHKIPFDKPQPTLRTPSLSLKRMPMFGRDLEEHMQVLGKYAESPYREIIDEFWGEVCELQDEDENWQMERPEVWAEASGWTKYELREGGGSHPRALS